MQFAVATIAAVAALLSSANAHIGMANPATYLSGYDNLPALQEDGSNFPCGVDTFDQLAAGKVPVLIPGQSSTVDLYGTATHGGGACQVSITYDSPPTKSSVWKVLRSYEGGCPADAAGNLPNFVGDIRNYLLPSLEYTVPTNLPSGPATIAWTWYNRLGNRELYMRCHKASVSGTNNDSSALSALPDMFVANLFSTTCKTVEGGNIRFPNPGEGKRGQGDIDPVGECGVPAAPMKRSVRFSKEHLERVAI